MANRQSLENKRDEHYSFGQMCDHALRSLCAKVFKQVNIHKAAGPEGLLGRILRASTDQLASVFTDIFNFSQSVIKGGGQRPDSVVPGQQPLQQHQQDKVADRGLQETEVRACPHPRRRGCSGAG